MNFDSTHTPSKKFIPLPARLRHAYSSPSEVRANYASCRTVPSTTRLF